MTADESMFRREAESASERARASLQGERLHDLVHRLARGPNEFWRDRLADIDPSHIRQPDDIAQLPFTTIDDRADTYPWAMLAVPREMTVHAHVSDHDGRPRLMAYTTQDVRVFAELAARAIVCAGGKADDLLLVVADAGPGLGALGMGAGGELLGATVVTVDATDLDRQRRLLADLEVDGVVCSDDSVAGLLDSDGGHAAAASPRYVLATGHGLRTADGRDVDAGAGDTDRGAPRIRELLGLPDDVGPAIAAGCVPSEGALHIFDDHLLPEVIDPVTGRRAVDGRPGELVVTTLTLEAIPLLRFRTSVTATTVRGSCPCGRTHQRIVPVDPDV